MPLATKNNAIIIKDGRLAENCGCCECPQDCPCGCSCGSPMPPQVTITLSEIPDTLFASPPRCYRFFNRSYTLCSSTAATDISPAYCNAQRLSYCKQFAGLCSRMMSYSWQGVDNQSYLNGVGGSTYDSCAFASAAFGDPIAGSGSCLGEFAFAAENLNTPLTLRGLYTKAVDEQGATTYVPAKLSGQCGVLSFEGYSQIWFGPGLSGMYLHNKTGLLKIDQNAFNRSQPLGVYARISISGSSPCVADRVVTGEPVFKTSNSVAVNGDGFSAAAFSKSITVTVAMDKFDYDAWSNILVGRSPNCVPCQDGHIKQQPKTTTWSLYRRERGVFAKCQTVFSDSNPAVPENVLGAPVGSVASLQFIPSQVACAESLWFWSFRASAPMAIFPKGMCGQADPQFVECPEQDLFIGPVTQFGTIGIAALCPAGEIPRNFYLTQWISYSGGGASQFTQSVDGSEPAPKFTSQGVEYTMKLGYRYRVTFS